MANRDYSKIRRTIGDFSQNVKGEEGTTVIANPELSGDEEALVGLQVGNKKYKVKQDINYRLEKEELTFTYEDGTTASINVVTDIIFEENTPEEEI